MLYIRMSWTHDPKQYIQTLENRIMELEDHNIQLEKDNKQLREFIIFFQCEASKLQKEGNFSPKDSK
jgi:hypothetical protein